MGVAIALLLAAVFGAGDQYLGSLYQFSWAADASLLSAPWLVLAFVAGCSQRDPKRAAWLGLGCTFAALAGYGVMTLSPIENAHYSLAGIAGFIRSDPPVFIGAIVTGPVFGWLGQRWRTGRSRVAGATAAATLCLEPLARAFYGQEMRTAAVWLAEIAAGLLLALYFVARRRRYALG